MRYHCNTPHRSFIHQFPSLYPLPTQILYYNRSNSHVDHIHIFPYPNPTSQPTPFPSSTQHPSHIERALNQPPHSVSTAPEPPSLHTTPPVLSNTNTSSTGFLNTIIRRKSIMVSLHCQFKQQTKRPPLSPFPPFPLSLPPLFAPPK